MSQPVLADAQFTVTRILTPHYNVASVYNGLPGYRPIMYSEGGVELDKLASAGITGYRSDLIKGTEVPLGSRVLLWLPKLSYSEDLPAESDFRWIFLWRLRNLFDFRQNRTPWHIPVQGMVPEPPVSIGDGNVLVPTADNVVTYVQAEPANTYNRVVQHPHAEDVSDTSGDWRRILGFPILSDGTAGAYAQGTTYSPVPGVTFTAYPNYWVHELQALGDELLLGVAKISDANWNFELEAVSFEDLIPSSRVYLMTGTAP